MMPNKYTVLCCMTEDVASVRSLATVKRKLLLTIMKNYNKYN